MIKRPLDARFAGRVLEGQKFTTIRRNPWPTGKPIMLYSWSGKPYRSPHKNVCAISVIVAQPIEITQGIDGTMHYDYPANYQLWQAEGFDSQNEMDEWFRKIVKPGKTITRHLMRFAVIAHQ